MGNLAQELLERDRANLAAGLEQMTAQWEQMGRRVQQQIGAIKYCDILIARVKGETELPAPGPDVAGDVATPAT